MKKLSKRTFVFIGILSLAVVGAAVTSNKYLSKAYEKPAQIVHPNNSQKYNENPEPKFVANNNKATKLLTEDEIKKKINDQQTKTQNSKVKSVKLKTWNEHISQDDPNDKGPNYEIDPNRMVWVSVTAYPDGLDTRVGFFSNAILTTVYDAETGETLKTNIKGDLKKKVK